MSDPYEVLGLKQGASEEEVKKAYKNLAKNITLMLQVMIRLQQRRCRRSTPPMMPSSTISLTRRLRLHLHPITTASPSTEATATAEAEKKSQMK